MRNCIRHRFTLWALAGGLIAAIGSPVALARDDDDLPGYVDGSAFADMADENSSIVHVTLDGALLKMVAGIADQQADGVGDFIGGIGSINAVVIEDARDLPAARRLMKSIATDLKQDGWERLALIREGDQLVVVYVLPNDNVLEGLTVMICEGSESGELVFVNIAGRIDFSEIGKIARGMGMDMDIPGLSELPPEIRKEIQKSVKKKKGRRRGTSDEDDEDHDW